MPTIEISPGWLNATYRILAGTDNNFGGASLLLTSTSPTSPTKRAYHTPLFNTLASSGSGDMGNRDQVLQIFQSGIDGVPTDFSGLTSKTSRSDDLLIEYVNLGSSSSEVIITGDYGRTETPHYIGASLTTSLKAASQSGTATWFRWYAAQTVFTATTPSFHQFIGTVGAEGSGADLELSSTSIVSGTQYRVIQLKFRMTGVWTYT